MNLIRILTADSQKNNLIYHLIENFYVILKKDNWLKSYIYWELELLKLIGFDLEFENLVEKNISNKQIEYTSKSIDKRIIPNFLVDKNDNIEDKETLLNGLKLVGDYLDKTILKPNNLNHPISRIQFINTLNGL